MASNGLYVIENASTIDLDQAEISHGWSIIIDGGFIREVHQGEAKLSSARKVDASGFTILPGLIDCHAHVSEVEASAAANARHPTSYLALRSAELMRAMLHRGFTTVRDAGGADHGLVRAVSEGLIQGPRLVISGKQLSQTCGHATDGGAHGEQGAAPFTRRLGVMRRVCDGVEAVRRACREELTAGAAFIKVMANGSVTSPSDPIDVLLFSNEELAAIVDEAAKAKTYVAAHAYTDEAIRRAVELGVGSIEHGNLVKPETAGLMAERGVVACPTLIALQVLAERAGNGGLSRDMAEKADYVNEAGFDSLNVFKEAGVTMAYGSDLNGPIQHRQNEEFSLRSRVLPAADVIASATTAGATLLRMEGRVGVVAPGAYADLIAVRGNPLKDISTLADPGRHLAMVMKGGDFIFNKMETWRSL